MALATHPAGAAMAILVRVLLAAFGTILPGLASAQEAPGQAAIVLEVSGAIGPATTGYVKRGLTAARERGAALVILRLDTPGGLDPAMREIIQAILSSPIPVATYVAPSGARAASAGTFILYASHLAAMAPGTNLGAATPVQLGGGPQPLEDGDEQAAQDGEQPDEAPQPRDAHVAKAVNDAVAYIRGLAALHGRNADWAERAVRQAASLPAREALDKDVIDIVAVSVDDLLAEADGRTVRLGGAAVTLDTAELEIVPIEPNWRERLLAVITNPTVAYVLMMVGIYGILIEVLSPGTIVAGVIGAISLFLALFALNYLPVNFAGAGLIVLGIALMAAEVFVSSMVLGIGGAIAFALGAIIMFDSGVPGFELSLTAVAIVTIVSVALFVLLLTVVLRTRRRKVVSGNEGFIGSPGRVVSWSGDTGHVLVHGEHWRARSPQPLAPGERVTVAGREGLVLAVEPEREPKP